MKKIKIEDAQGQNWETYLILYDTGLGAIENDKSGQIERIYINSITINKLWDLYTKKKIVEITPANKITTFLIKIGLIKLNIKYKEEDL